MSRLTIPFCFHGARKTIKAAAETSVGHGFLVPRNAISSARKLSAPRETSSSPAAILGTPTLHLHQQRWTQVFCNTILRISIYIYVCILCQSTSLHRRSARKTPHITHYSAREARRLLLAFANGERDRVD